MADRFAALRNGTASAFFHGSGATPTELREAIATGTPPRDLVDLVEKIWSRAYVVTDQDLNALRTRYSEDQLFEIIVAAAVGAAQDRLAAACRALEDA
jgi:alkylhydroperoxidase family enzyme